MEGRQNGAVRPATKDEIYRSALVALCNRDARGFMEMAHVAGWDEVDPPSWVVDAGYYPWEVLQAVAAMLDEIGTGGER